ncbi:stalk domain-containing protein [Thermoanaerobacterium sp. RBIITD]|uniref:stalk domain-containing protein n=1 Tax=Thermoanaerobacterium sp. RBIITD TaxID=1550240 RepID=UPI000BC02ADC|nr:stalk domain-containing protein [Thermoanaerobacterium sp. RBIITD]SNX52618.1 Copper amine oxidase N-terminal domain-containing protein [Thermoanaerobacterium sp. RBIITD]
MKFVFLKRILFVAIFAVVCTGSIAYAVQDDTKPISQETVAQAGFSQELDNGMIIYKDSGGGTVIHFPYVPKIKINGQEIKFIQESFTLIDGITLVPVREFFEKLGATVNWYSGSQTIIVKKDNMTVELTIGSKAVKINEKISELPAKVRLVNNCTYIPLRFISEAFEDIVNYKDGIITINTTQDNVYMLI